VQNGGASRFVSFDLRQLRVPDVRLHMPRVSGDAGAGRCVGGRDAAGVARGVAADAAADEAAISALAAGA